MKFLADENIEKEIVDFFKKGNFDIKWALEEFPSAEDEFILNLAHHEKRIILTNDKDFGDLIFRNKKKSSGVILFRIKGELIHKKIKILKALLSEQRKFEDFFIVIGDKKIRVNSLKQV